MDRKGRSGSEATGRVRRGRTVSVGSVEERTGADRNGPAGMDAIGSVRRRRDCVGLKRNGRNGVDGKGLDPSGMSRTGPAGKEGEGRTATVPPLRLFMRGAKTREGSDQKGRMEFMSAPKRSKKSGPRRGGPKRNRRGELLAAPKWREKVMLVTIRGDRLITNNWVVRRDCCGCVRPDGVIAPSPDLVRSLQL